MKMTPSSAKWFETWRTKLVRSPQAAAAWQFQQQLAVSECLEATKLAALLKRQCQGLLEHTGNHVPYYRNMLRSRPDVDSLGWLEIPILDRAALQANQPALMAAQLPPGHQILGTLRSSGSTGTPVEIITTNITNTWQKALALRAARWANRNFEASLGIIRKVSDPTAKPPYGTALSHWGDVTGFPFKTGVAYRLNAQSSSTIEHRDWLQRTRPNYLMTYPSLLRELAIGALDRPMQWRPSGLSTLGETVDDELRSLVRELWDLPIDDVYSAEECGLMAIQCSGGKYHVQSECVHVEVLDEEGMPCVPGEIGRVVVTTLTNMATPLIRYALGDYAKLGDFCTCGNNLPVIERVLGRQRNLLITNRGNFWPSFGTRQFRDVAPIMAQQFRQTALDQIEMHYVASETLGAVQRAEIVHMIETMLPVKMNVTLIQVAQLARGSSGKLEPFVSAISQPVI